MELSRRLLALVPVLLLVPHPALSQDASEALASSDAKAKQRSETAKARRERSIRIARSRPVRRDTPLREENLRDLEITEIERAVRDLYPGALVYLSAVTSGCPCEDGPSCEDQIWTVAETDGTSRGLLLSRIDEKWQVGPVQAWWLVYAELQDAIRKLGAWPTGDVDPAEIRYRRDLWSRVEEHREAFPDCVTDVNEVIRELEHID